MPAALALAVSLLVAAPPPVREPVKLASPGFTGVDVSSAQATFFSDHLAQQLTLRGLQVTTASQIGALLGFERQRQLLGCKEDTSSCMAELAAALGVDGVVTGSVGRFDNTFQVNVSVVSTKDGRTLSAFSRKVNGSSAVLDALNDAADQVARDLTAKLRGSAPAPTQAPAPSPQITGTPIPRQPHTRPAPLPPGPGPAPITPPAPPSAAPDAQASSTGGGLRDWSWLPAGAGVVAGAGAAVMFTLARGPADQFERAIHQPLQNPLSEQEALEIQARGRMYSNLGYALTAVGAIGLGAGAYFYLAGGPQPLSLRVAPGPAGVAVSGSFP